ncbi:hypothetical protein [Aestuariivirga sp.]|uniref:hypothetical protein n=1 Tax=Aestuariivirga sp. TaxID=2650926 RepID=UPI0039E68563
MIKANGWMALVYALVITGFALLSELWKGSSGSGVAQLFAAVYLAIPAHLTVLRNISGKQAMEVLGKRSSGTGNIMSPFLWRAFGMSLLSILIAAPFFIIALMFGAPEYVAYGCGGIGLLAGSVFAFAKWGTMFPAIVAGDNPSMAAASGRGKQIFGYAAPRLLLCFGLLSVLIFIIAYTGALLSDGKGEFFCADGRFNFIFLIGMFLAGLINAYQVVTTAVILSRAYLKAGGSVAAIA